MDTDVSLEAAERERQRPCLVCGVPYASEEAEAGCPVCLLRRALQPESRAEDELATHDSPVLPTAGRFDHYELARRKDGEFDQLGRGVMGITYKAFDTVLHRSVALKVINPQVAADPNVRQRFLREARAAARLRHPHVASVFYYGVRPSDGQCFYAMEWVEGETLEARLRRAGPLPVAEALEIVAQVARALGAAEVQGVVHRDLKPANLMLVQGLELLVKVIDFGLAKVAVTAEEPDLTRGGFVGTPAFASPEQLAGGGVDIRSDLYSLGVTLWQMLTGEPPFHGSQAEVMHQHLHAPLPLAKLQGVPQPVVVLLQMLLDKDPTRRFQDPAQLLQVMRKVLDAVEAGRIIEPLGVRKMPHKPAGPRQKAQERLRARKLYARGMALLDLLDPAATRKAIEFFKRAIEQDSNFALGYVGLASSYLEQEGFRGQKAMLDSAVECARRAIALEPSEVRSYTTLARAYHRKGWYPQCDEALQKALELGPNDDTANALAATRAISKHQFSEAYYLFRKAYFLNPRETWRIYFATEILFRADMSDLAEKWMQRALDQETSPQLHRLMECYRMMWRRRFTNARTGFMKLPPKTHLAPKLQSTIYSVSDGLLYCAVGLEDWPAVINACNAHIDANRESLWARTYLALGLKMSGRETEAREVAEEVLERGIARLELPAQPDIPWDVPLYVAWAYRFVGRQAEAYCYLHQYLTHRTLLHMPLGLENPILDVFKNDPEFNTILADLKQKLEGARRSIREHEAASAQG